MTSLRLNSVERDAPSASCSFSDTIIEWERQPPTGFVGPPHYWRTLHSERYLLKVGFEPETGALLGFTLVFYNGRVGRWSPQMGQMESKTGLPRFDVAPWAGPEARDHWGIMAITSRCECRLDVGESDVRIGLGESTPASSVKFAPSTAMEFDADNLLVAIHVSNVTEGNIDRVLRSVGA